MTQACNDEIVTWILRPVYKVPDEFGTVPKLAQFRFPVTRDPWNWTN